MASDKAYDVERRFNALISGASGPVIPPVSVSGPFLASQIGAIGVCNANPYFAGGDSTGWFRFNGTFTVTASVPPGAPYKYAGLFAATGTGGHAYETDAPTSTGNPTVMPAVGGQQYLITAWVNSPYTLCYLGITWQAVSGTNLSDSTAPAITIPANTWTQVSAVLQAPNSATLMQPHIGTDNGNSIYFEAFIVSPQVPGQLIQAGTIEAAQLIAAFFSGLLIEGAQFVSGGAGVTGFFAYSGTPGPGNDPVSWITQPGVTQDPFGNVLPLDSFSNPVSGGIVTVGVGGEVVQVNNGAISFWGGPPSSYAIPGGILVGASSHTLILESPQIGTDTQSLVQVTGGDPGSIDLYPGRGATAITQAGLILGGDSHATFVDPLDANTYDLQAKHVAVYPAQTVTSTTAVPVTGASAPVGAAHYRFRAVIYYSPLTGTPAPTFGFTAPATTGNVSSNATYATAGGTALGRGIMSLTPGGGPAMNGNAVATLEGDATFSAAGTLQLTTLQTGGTSFEVQTAYLDLYPVS